MKLSQLLVILQMMTGGGGSHGLDTPLKKFLAVTWQSPWLIPYESELYWMVPTAALVLLIPFFFASWFIEYQVGKRILRDIESTKIKEAVLKANLLSYGLLGLYCVGMFYF